MYLKTMEIAENFNAITDLRRVDLDKLDLAHKKLIKIESNSFQHLNKLQILNLGSNRIEQIEINRFQFQGLDNLEELNLSDNKLTKIESNSFQHLKTLKLLYLNSNQIEQIEINGFKRLKNLKVYGVE